MTRTMRILGIVLLLALPLPIVIVIGSSFNPGGYIKFPPEGFSLRWYVEALTDPRWPRAFFISILIAGIVSVIVTATSFLTAYFALRYAPRLATALEIAIFSPLFFPSAAMGVGFVILLAKFGLVGVMTGIVLAHLVVTLPFAYRPIYVAMRSIDPDVVRAANVLGASEWRSIWDVVLPMSRSGIMTALLFSAIISFDEVTITMFLIGPHITTLPVQIYAFIQDTSSPVLSAISTISVVITLVAVMILERTVGLAFFVRREAV